MLTLAEVLDDAAALDDFSQVAVVDVNTRGASGWTPLHWMACLGDLPGIRLLVDAGASIDAADNAGNTPLHEAVDGRHHFAVELLLALGARADLQNTEGVSARQLAERMGFQPTVELFGDAG